ncbi:MAG: SGNH/GDSL hydrolase family protein [Myxococcota bacterium]
MKGASGAGRRSRGRTALFVVLAALLSIAIVEVFARVVVPPQWLHDTYPDEDALLAEHPQRGYGLRRDLVRSWAQHDGDFEVEVRLNSDGQRDAEAALARRADLRILAAGDSFTFGIGVEGDERWSEVLEASLARRFAGQATVSVYNAGVPGYSATQIRQVIEEWVPRLEPRLVVFGAYANSYWRVETPYELLGGTLVSSRVSSYVHVSPEGDLIASAFEPGWLRRLDVGLKRFLHVGAHLLSSVNRFRHWPRMSARPLDEPSVRRDYVAASREIAAANRFVVEHGGRMLLLAINGQQRDGSFLPIESVYNDVLRQTAEREGILFVESLPELARLADGRRIYRFEHDIHWTPAAHEAAARLLESRLDQAGLLPDAGRGGDAAGAGRSSTGPGRPVEARKGPGRFATAEAAANH